MTISSYPQLKFLIAVVAGIAVGIWLDSWGWGIGTFFGLMFIFIWVASWIFGSPFDKSKVPVTDELRLLLSTLAKIGAAKNRLPLAARGWCNSLGLYVQMKEMGPRARLLAGDDKYHSRIDAWSDDSIDWKVRKYEAGSWVRLVAPTSELADWLYDHGGVPEEYVGPLKKAIEAFVTTGRLTLPLDIEESGSCVLGQSATSHDAEEPSPEEDLGRVVKQLHPQLDDSAVDDAVRLVREPVRHQDAELADEAQQWLKHLAMDASYSGLVWPYDLQLKRDIANLEEHATKVDRAGAQLMLSQGMSQETVRQALEESHAKGDCLNFMWPGPSDVWRAAASLRESALAYKQYRFRLVMYKFPRANFYVQTDNARSVLDVSQLDEEELNQFWELVEVTFRVHNLEFWIPVFTVYPTIDLMQFIKTMLEKHSEDELLTACD